MKYTIPHTILCINEPIERQAAEDVLLCYLGYAFHWANEMGFKGKKVYGLHLLRGDPTTTPSRPSELRCEIECSLEERKAWEENLETNIKHAVLTALSED